MTSFSNLASRRITPGTTARYELYDIGMEGAALIVAPATRSNKEYQSSYVKLMAPQQKRVANSVMTAEFLDTYKESTVPLYAKHILKGWEGIVDADGKAAPFTAENALKFLEALPIEMFDAITVFCENPTNFYGVSKEDAKELAKN